MKKYEREFNRTTDFIDEICIGVDNGLDIGDDCVIIELNTIADEIYDEQIKDLLDSYKISDDSKDYKSMLLDAMYLGFYYGQQHERSCNAGKDPENEAIPIKKKWETAPERAKEREQKEDERHEAMMKEAYARKYGVEE
jgi:hypothetical protein